MPSPSKRGCLFWTATIVAVLGVLIVVASIPAVGSYRSKAVRAQRVELDEAAASLFGDADAYTEIGSPQLLIIEDQGAFLPGTAKDGAKLVSENYLRERQIYPLQLRTVEYVAGLGRLAGVTAICLAALVLIYLQIRRRKSASHSVAA